MSHKLYSAKWSFFGTPLLLSLFGVSTIGADLSVNEVNCEWSPEDFVITVGKRSSRVSPLMMHGSLETDYNISLE